MQSDKWELSQYNSRNIEKILINYKLKIMMAIGLLCAAD